MDGRQNDLSQKIDNLQYSISRLTNLNIVQEKGKFPSQPHQNPKGIHEVEAQEGESSQVREVKVVITLRSGKEVDLPTSKPEHEPESQAEKEKREERKKKGNSAKNEDLKSTMNKELERTINQEDLMKKHTAPPFLQALHGKKGINNVSKILEVLRQVKVNIPLLDMIKQCKSPVKYKDPGCPTISVMIGETCVEKALLDLGASVNLPPYSVYKQLGVGELKPTSITLSLANRSMKFQEKMLEDLNESLGDLDEGLPKPSDLLATLPPLKMRKEILHLFNGEETQEAVKEEPPKLILRCKKAIGWKISDLKGINPLVCTHHIYMEEEAKPVRQPQKGWRVCIDYRKLNAVTRKDHFPLPFIDQVLERVSGHPFYCFLDGYSEYFQVEIVVEDQEKTTFTCPFGTYAYKECLSAYAMHQQHSKYAC
ncbi:hypothetical protein CK203_041579 [Vitis vinifera]|uniref:Transposon Ty3-I Gag-Pol polyprotein n=1 Tax=Vitis vinifera TaxID=29760 RepID=A0A438I7L7_VITVI|nr:hypothetical protein CK203_041579 [Vitis vinifera]